MQSFGNASLIARLISLAGLQALAVLGSSDESHLDQVSLVQTHANVSNDMIGEHGLKFRMEDAESLFDIATRVVRDPSMGSTLPEKGVALLQNLAKHHSVVSSGHQETLERAAESVKKEFATVYSEESRAGVSVGRDPDWVVVNDKIEGMCWDYHGGKPLQCKVPSVTLGPITDFVGFADKCQKLCADFDWCSGYGYLPAKEPAVEDANEEVNVNLLVHPLIKPDEEFCTLMNNGAEPCPNSWETFGVMPLMSSRDFTVWEAYTDRGVPGTNYDYQCVAKYQHDPQISRASVPGMFKFPTLAPVISGSTIKQPAAFCMHKEVNNQGKNKPLHSCKVKEVDYATAALKGFKTKRIASEDADWATICERICAGLDWCAGYSLVARVKFPFSDAHPEECHLHSSLQNGCPEGHSWEINRRHFGERMAVETATDIVPGPPQKGVVMCKSKAQSLKGWFQDKLAPGPNSPLCRAQKVFQIGQAAMAIAYLIGNWDCATRTDSNARLADPNHRRNAAATKNAGRHHKTARHAHLEATGRTNATSIGNASRFAQRGRASRHRKSSPEGRAALANILGSDDKTDLSALKLSKREESTTCYLLTNGGSARWGLSSLAYYFTKQYRCAEDPGPDLKSDVNCKANLLRVLGRSLGAGIYGYASITENCGADPVEPSKFFCGLDYAKMVLYFSKVIFHVIHMTVFMNDEQKWERGTAGVEAAASFVFILESIIRTMGPCLGELQNNEDATIIEDGSCIASYLEEVGLSSYAISSAVTSFNYCVAKQ